MRAAIPCDLFTALKTLPWLWLRRKHFDVAVSHYFALHRIEREGPQDHEVPPYDFAEIEEMVAALRPVARYWARFFAQHGISPTELWYAQIRPVDLRPVVIAAAVILSGLSMARPPGRMPYSDLKQEICQEVRGRIAGQHFGLERRSPAPQASGRRSA